RKIKAFAADTVFWLLTKRLFPIDKKIGARDFAFHENRMAGLLPTNGVGHFAADAGLLGEHHPTAITPQPGHGERYQFCVSHTRRMKRKIGFEKWLESYELRAAGFETGAGSRSLCASTGRRKMTSSKCRAAAISSAEGLSGE